MIFFSFLNNCRVHLLALVFIFILSQCTLSADNYKTIEWKNMHGIVLPKKFEENFLIDTLMRYLYSISDLPITFSNILGTKGSICLAYYNHDTSKVAFIAFMAQIHSEWKIGTLITFASKKCEYTKSFFGIQQPVISNISYHANGNIFQDIQSYGNGITKFIKYFTPAGKSNGKWIYFDEKGRKTKIEKYKNDNLLKQKEYIKPKYILGEKNKNKRIEKKCSCKN